MLSFARPALMAANVANVSNQALDSTNAVSTAQLMANLSRQLCMDNATCRKKFYPAKNDAAGVAIGVVGDLVQKAVDDLVPAASYIPFVGDVFASLLNLFTGGDEVIHLLTQIQSELD